MVRSGYVSLSTLFFIVAVSTIASGVATADRQSLLDYSNSRKDGPDLEISSVETSAECEARVASGGGQASSNKASAVYAIGEDCRTGCEKYAAPEGHKWFGKAPSCTGDKMNPKKRAYKDCVEVGGEPVDWSYCGGGKPCLTGNKILCKMPTAEDYSAKVGFDGDLTWFGKAPACNANNGERDCKAIGGTVASKSRCTDGSGGRKAECCTTGKMVACVVPKQAPSTSGTTSDIRWLGKPPACNANKTEKECANLGGKVEKKDKCTDGSDGGKKKCCTTGKMVKCVVPRITE